MKYKIKMLAYHSVHNEYNDIAESFVKLKWKSDDMQEDIVN